ncbi:MAG: SMC-Scp complex subunit ScpB [Verrucomicrobia bacterium]|nr:SMC-Scp complex subunit ScpB [Verrucomicrobiota bacterium]
MNINETEMSNLVENASEFSSQTNGALPQLSEIVEALLFASQKAVTLKELLGYFKGAAAAAPESAASAFTSLKEKDLVEVLDTLKQEIASSNRPYELRETASGWQLVTASPFAPWLRQLFPEARPTRLSAPALETLAIIAYRQPIIRADIEAVRGVAVDGVMQTLLDRGLIRIAGRSEVPGRPLLYTTTQAFLDHFGLRALEELPNAAELRYIPLPQSAASSAAAEAELPLFVSEGSQEPVAISSEESIEEKNEN